MIELKFNEINQIEYTNWKGSTRVRYIIPIKLTFGRTEYHPQDQWLVQACDCEDRQMKHFALKDLQVCPV